MKQIRRRIPSVLYTLPFLIFVFVLIVVSSYLLAANGFEGVFSATLFNTPRGILLLVAGPFALLVFLGLFLFGIISDSLHRSGPSRFSARVFLVFCLLLFSATLPQTVILGRFVSSALSSWFDHSVSESLTSAEDIAALYTAERMQSLERVSGRFLNGLAISNYRERPVDWMNEIRTMDSHAAACQVYLETRLQDAFQYLPIVETGDSGQFVPRLRLGLVRNGYFTLADDAPVFRYGQIVRYSNATYICVYSSLIPDGFESSLAQIRDTANQARIIDTLKPFLPLMGIWIFAMFLLPSILMALILAFYASSRISDPVRAISEAAARLAEGDPSFLMIPHSKDELGEIAVLLNSVADNISAGKKPDKKAVLRL